nr:putative internal virion protein [uncultured Mediterranean phage uvMED]BAR28945.1 putative internal virion protein [uncultured Mediterranean phage uvMED]
MAQLGFGLNINETAAKTGYDQYSVRLGETLGAVAADNWNFNPLSSIGTYWDMESARSQAIEENQNRVSRDELNKEYADLGLFFKEDEFQSVVDIMVEEKKEERQRQSIIQRGPKGIAVGAAKFATGLAVSLFDPINIAASFIPVFGQARFAGLVARQGFTRARLARGVTEGAVGAAVVEPIVYGVAQKVQADYGLADSLLNITFGTILGGGLHVGAGKLKDLRTASKFKERMKEAGTPDEQLNLYKEYYPENSRVMRDLEMTNPQTRKLLLEKSLNDLLLEKPVDVSPVVSADPVLKNSTDTVATSQIRSKSVSEVDQMELNTVEQNVSNKQSPDIDIENNNLEVRLNAIKENQKTRNILLDEDVETRTTKEELDEVNTRSKDLDEIIKDAINCVNGR